MAAEYDVAIVGGGPVGATCSTLLKKYNPDLRVLVVEKERFPRDHIGESQLPSIMPILDEMGVWEKVEAAGFPVKIGASYTWGASDEKWDFDFYPAENWEDQPRPAKFEGQRRYTAFQVDRARFDEILLRHAQEHGVEVREGVRVEEVLAEGDRVEGLRLDTGETVRAKYYVDGSGVVGLLRRAMGVASESPKELRNIAIWDYWENAEWAVEVGVGATRVQVRSLPYGWIWFIPLGPTRTSIGLICPSEYYKSRDESPAEMYHRALREQPEVASLIENAEASGDVQTCKDWSHLAERLVGENWFLCGEAAGFADPILAAGMSLAHSSAKEAAYTILELERGELEASWLRERYNDRNRMNIEQHIRFAQFWYSANGCFTDLKEQCQKIAREAGLRLSPQQAWQWLSQGGFSTEQVGYATFGSFDVASAKQIIERFDERGRSCRSLVNGYNVFKLNLKNAQRGHIGHLRNGRIRLVDCYRRGNATLPLTGYYGLLVGALQTTSDAAELLQCLKARLASEVPAAKREQAFDASIQALEAMCEGGWVLRSVDKKRPKLTVSHDGSRYIRSSAEGRRAIEESGRGDQVKYRV